MVELNAENAKLARLSRKKFSKKQSLELNYAIAKAKVSFEGKGNPLFKMFGSLTAYQGQHYSIDQLEELSLIKDVSMESILRAYKWALEKLNSKQEEPEWVKNTFY